MPDQMNADARIKFALGTHFVEAQLLQDQVAELTAALAAKDREITQLKDALRTAADEAANTK